MLPTGEAPKDPSPSVGDKRVLDQATGGLSPPRKLLKVDAVKSLTTKSSRKASVTGPPVIRVSAASSKIPVSDRQQMLQRLYTEFCVLYQPLLAQRPDLPAEHALAQEVEIYNRTNTRTYRNATTNAIISIKKRASPTGMSHPSVGTESELQARVTASKEYSSLELRIEDLESLVLSSEQLVTWGFVTKIPIDWGPGADVPSQTGKTALCDRCREDFTVTDTPDYYGCLHHWGRIMHKKVEGSRKKIYTCCQMEHPHEGCSRGCHVFYESDPSALHSRHSFSFSSHPKEDQFGEVGRMAVAIDCEMVYTTAGMSVARVSIVDEDGVVLFDELVKPSEGVTVTDYNTRFSGVTSLETATMDLIQIRTALREIIGPRTIVIGHAVDNDLKTLRMVHNRVIDTVQLFVHPDGPPRRRALRELAREYLNRRIQAGADSSGEKEMGVVGHSSVEDSRAALDLVRWYICEKRKRMELR